MTREHASSPLPRFLVWLIERFCRQDLIEEFQGDLEELHAMRSEERAPWLASMLIWLDGLSLLRVHFRRIRESRTILPPISMFRNYFVVAVRSLRRYAAFASINILGLSVSMAVGLILILFIRQASTQDEFHDNSDRIVRVYSDFKASFNRSNALYGTSPANLSGLMTDEIPGIERTTQVRSGFRGTLQYGDVGLPLNGLYADPAFFEIFSFDLRAGDPATALAQPGSLVLSPAEAEKFFGSEDPMGQTMSTSDGQEFTVTGILAKDDYHSIIPLRVLASYATLESDEETRIQLGNWWQSIYRSYTFVLLAEGTSHDVIQQRVRALLPVHFADQGDNRLVDLHVQPLGDINLGVMMGNEIGPSLPAGAAWFLGTLAMIILLTACFNYVGLTVSRSLKRSREVGVRKVFGAARSHVSTQFIFETMLVSAVSVLLAVVWLQWLIPSFNSLSFVSQTGMLLDVDFLGDAGLYGVLVVFTVAVALFAGFYPALFLSRFAPAEAVRGARDTAGSGGTRLRKTLVVVQFAVSLIFLVVAVTMVRQARYVERADYGFDQENLINVRLFDVPYDRFRDRVEASSHVEEVSATSIVFAQGSRSDVWVSMPGMSDDEATKGYQWAVDDAFVSNHGLELIAGSPLTSEMIFPDVNKVLVNERAIEALQMASPLEAIGQTFIMGDSTRVEIAGVLKNFHADTFTEAIAPYVFLNMPSNVRWANVRFVPGQQEQAVEDIVAAWASMGHTRSVEWALFETQLKESMVNLMIRDMYRLIGFLAFLAVLIACLGLLGIASFNVERRTREISIRKVMGASSGSLLTLLSREFMILIGIATVFAAPIAWIAANAWLQEFEYRIDAGMSTLLLALGILLALAFAAIGSQTWRASQTNPIDQLRTD